MTFPAVKLKTYRMIFVGDLHKAHSPILFKNDLNYHSTVFYEQAKHMRGSRKNFTFSSWPLNSCL